jgi:UDP-glucuronate decarboxylase
VQALKNKDITIYGDGSQTRSFCYVDDLVEGIIKMMNSREDFVGPVNLDNPKEFTIINLAKKIIKLTNSKSKIIYTPLSEDDPKRRKPNIELAKKELKWEPKIKIDEGLKKLLIIL